jgi:hypothetical protein
MSIGKALRDHRAVMATPQELAGYDAGASCKGVGEPGLSAMLAAYEAELDHPDPVKAARARGLVRALRGGPR